MNNLREMLMAATGGAYQGPWDEASMMAALEGLGAGGATPGQVGMANKFQTGGAGSADIGGGMPRDMVAKVLSGQRGPTTLGQNLPQPDPFAEVTGPGPDTQIIQLMKQGLRTSNGAPLSDEDIAKFLAMVRGAGSKQPDDNQFNTSASGEDWGAVGGPSPY